MRDRRRTRPSIYIGGCVRRVRRFSGTKWGSKATILANQPSPGDRRSARSVAAQAGQIIALGGENGSDKRRPVLSVGTAYGTPESSLWWDGDGTQR
jgi:hypothetical protein